MFALIINANYLVDKKLIKVYFVETRSAVNCTFLEFPRIIGEIGILEFWKPEKLKTSIEAINYIHLKNIVVVQNAT